MILNISSLNQDQKKQVVDIFYLTSEVKSFPTSEFKEKFIYNYLLYYFDHFPKYCFACLEDGQVLGYIVSAPESLYAIENFSYYAYFLPFLGKYPAHLHINCHPSSQGKGVGGKLWQKLKGELQEDQITGLHIITALGAKNIDFYKKNDFNFTSAPMENLIFMGITL